eukprot:scaffold1450_cov119-Isochrysis_galbana.AAC.2
MRHSCQPGVLPADGQNSSIKTAGSERCSRASAQRTIWGGKAGEATPARGPLKRRLECSPVVAVAGRSPVAAAAQAQAIYRRTRTDKFYKSSQGRRIECDADAVVPHCCRGCDA